MSDDKKQKEKISSLIENNMLPNVWIDTMRLGLRKDGICSLSFSSQLPAGYVEQIRVMTGQAQLKAFVDLICDRLEYYPVKKDQEPETTPH